MGSYIITVYNHPFITLGWANTHIQPMYHQLSCSHQLPQRIRNSKGINIFTQLLVGVVVAKELLLYIIAPKVFQKDSCRKNKKAKRTQQKARKQPKTKTFKNQNKQNQNLSKSQKLGYQNPRRTFRNTPFIKPYGLTNRSRHHNGTSDRRGGGSLKIC